MPDDETDGTGRGGRVSRDDWKYDEDMWDEKGKEEEKILPEKQCPQCLHWVPREYPSCSWCGKPFRERDGS